MNRKKEITKIGEQDCIRFWSHVDKSGECWVWTARKTTKGYGHFSYGGKNRRAHRFAWLITKGHIPNGLFVCHHCDNPSCVRPSHLFLGTHTDNMRDCAKKGRIKSTLIKPYLRKVSAFTWDIVCDIRRRYEEGRATQGQLSRELGISKSTIRGVLYYKSWRERGD